MVQKEGASAAGVRKFKMRLRALVSPYARVALSVLVALFPLWGIPTSSDPFPAWRGAAVIRGDLNAIDCSRRRESTVRFSGPSATAENTRRTSQRQVARNLAAMLGHRWNFPCETVYWPRRGRALDATRGADGAQKTRSGRCIQSYRIPHREMRKALSADSDMFSVRGIMQRRDVGRLGRALATLVPGAP
jgi:hypothetical protein